MPMYHLFEKKKTFCYIVGKMSKSTKNFLSKYLNVKKLFSFVYFTPPPPMFGCKETWRGRGMKKKKRKLLSFSFNYFQSKLLSNIAFFFLIVKAFLVVSSNFCAVWRVNSYIYPLSTYFFQIYFPTDSLSFLHFI